MTITREQGYAIEGGPEPKPAEDSPERLRERREALGKDDAWIEHILSALDVGAGPDFGYGRERRIAAEWVSSYTEKSTVTMRAAYAAALSVAEAERAAKPDHLAYADSPVWDDGPMPKPERAPEVVDVPQPETWHARLVRLATEAQAAGKACAEAEAAFTQADADREKARLARAAAREMCHAKRQALTEATAAASIIRDAQQGGAS